MPNTPQLDNNIIQHVTRTIYGSYLQTCRVLRRPMDIKEFTTINEVINDEIKVPFQPQVGTIGLQETESFDPQNDSDLIDIGYVIIGNGGHVTNISGNNVPYMSANIHQATDAAPFKIIPFVCKPIEQDISDAERENYRLRKVLEIDGELYVAYFAKKLSFNNSEVNMIKSVTTNGETTYTPFIPTINNLRPIPIQPGVENDGSKVFASANGVFTFTEKDIALLMEACINMYGSISDAVISEIALCSGVDKAVVRSYPSEGAQTAGGAIANRNLKEAVAVQVCCFINSYYQANYGMSGFEIAFDIGAIEPLFGKSA